MIATTEVWIAVIATVAILVAVLWRFLAWEPDDEDLVEELTDRERAEIVAMRLQAEKLARDEKTDAGDAG